MKTVVCFAGRVGWRRVERMCRFVESCVRQMASNEAVCEKKSGRIGHVRLGMIGVSMGDRGSDGLGGSENWISSPFISGPVV